ncbi:MAG TPA: hypothetical protein ENN53_04535 [Candidatus Acetothermia bacterium]|nr:hypothetical protein [Candidatus Acetothermia bacterium]
MLECPCRAARESPCLPLDVCLVIGEPFASCVALLDASPGGARGDTVERAFFPPSTSSAGTPSPRWRGGCPRLRWRGGCSL